MPRLVGKPSHTGENVAALLILAALVGVVLEYVGVVDVVPGFGRESRYNWFQNQATSERVLTGNSQE